MSSYHLASDDKPGEEEKVWRVRSSNEECGACDKEKQATDAGPSTYMRRNEETNRRQQKAEWSGAGDKGLGDLARFKVANSDNERESRPASLEDARERCSQKIASIRRLAECLLFRICSSRDETPCRCPARLNGVVDDYLLHSSIRLIGA